MSIWRLSVSVKYCAAGRHVVVATKGEINTWLKGAFVEELVYYPSVSFPKLAILCLYLRIFTTRFYRYSAHICAWIIISSIVVFIIVSLTACKPLAFKWNKTIQGHCIDQVASYRYVSLPNLITDLIILILPHPVIWHLHTGRIQKVALTITFLTGSMWVATTYGNEDSINIANLEVRPAVLSQQLCALSSIWRPMFLKTLPGIPSKWWHGTPSNRGCIL